MKRKISAKIAICCGRKISKLFYKFPISTDLLIFCEMQLLDDDDLGIMMEIWGSTRNFSDLDIDEVPDDIDDEGPEKVEDAHTHFFSNPSRGIILWNDPKGDMLSIGLDTTHASEFLQYTVKVHAHKLASNLQLEEL
ncbi:hypothetical protein GOBAR_DD32875 [Gossypium barbadense]|nr:hypothetical protein GOBAR_DD32875 [Gossypium barbadense]